MLNLYDVIVSSIIIACFFSGLYKGAVRLMLSNISFVFSVLFSYILFPSAQGAVSEYIESTTVANAVSCCVAYIISLIICSVFFSKIKPIIKPMCGGMIDKFLGAMLGMLNGFLLSMLIFVVVTVASSHAPLPFNENFYVLLKAAQENEHPKWIKSANSFHFMDKLLRIMIKDKYIAEFLKKIDLGAGYKHDKSEKEKLDFEIDQLLENE